MKYIFKICGHFTISTPEDAEKYLNKAITHLYLKMIYDELGEISINRTSISFNRKYDLIPGKPCRFGAFNPGSIMLESSQKTICVNYCFGLMSLITPLIIGIICVIYIAYYNLNLAFFAITLILILMTIGVVLELIITRRWLKDVIGDSISSKI